MLANSVSVSCGIPMTIPYVAIHAMFNCISSMLTLTFLQRLKLWLITLSSCSNTLFVDGRSALLMADYITSNSMKSLMLLWSLLLAIRRIPLVMLLPTNIVMALTTPSLVPMTNWLMTFSQSASSCASARAVMEGLMVLPVDAVSLSALLFASLICSLPWLHL